MLKAELIANPFLLIAFIFLFYYIRKKGFPYQITGISAFLVGVAPLIWILVPDGFFFLRIYCNVIFIHLVWLFFFLSFYTQSRNQVWFYRGISFSLMLIFVYAFFIEPKWLETTTLEIHSTKIQKPLKISVISDIQIDELTDFERKVFDEAKKFNPDIILFPGDFVQVTSDSVRVELYAELNKLLIEGFRNTSTKFYAVGGNVDAFGWNAIFKGLDATCFNTSESIQTCGITITGLDLENSTNLSIPIEKTDNFHIVFGHCPDFALSQTNANLLIAGHTHGGQLQIPFFGPVLTLSKVPRSWASGKTQIDSTTILYVSRGIGMERIGAPRFRFNCRPELVNVRLLPI